jgi:hypothetical protein
MRVMVMVKASKASEAGVMPSQQLLANMGRFNEQLVKAGVMLAGEGLRPSAKGTRMRFSGASRTVIDGPFAETKELVAGFWLWQVRSMAAALPEPAPRGLRGRDPTGVRSRRFRSGADNRAARTGGSTARARGGRQALTGAQLLWD